MCFSADIFNFLGEIDEKSFHLAAMNGRYRDIKAAIDGCRRGRESEYSE
jgi:hypothetical protein